MIDLKAIEGTLAQVIALSNLGASVAVSAIGLVKNVVDALKARGYEADTAKLDALIADAMRRQLIAEQEKNAQS